MIDNNGFIVFHPSIKKEIATSQLDFKGTSHSVDLDKFEIPIHNDDEFEELEHEMIDGKTSNMTLDNWKREGLRVVKRRTEYVYTPVEKTPFRVAIASPNSFGRYYIELPFVKEKDYEKILEDLEQPGNAKFDTNIQLYNCSYTYSRLSDRITFDPTKQINDFCIRYLSKDREQVLAIKSDLVLHSIYYNLYNYSQFSTYPNLVKSSFYGTYSGITFYLPVTLYRPKLQSSNTTTPSDESVSGNSQPEGEIEMEAYNSSLNLFTTEGDKHTYSFEKPYYTRSIEFSDYLRTEFKNYGPIVIYFLNETVIQSTQSNTEATVSASMPLWLEKVPTAVAGVVYNSSKFEQLMFHDMCNENNNETCFNICQRKPGVNVTCYLVDHHGIVVITNGGSLGHLAMGQPLYKINPWLMMSLEIDGIFDLIITGNKLQDCAKPKNIVSAGSRLINLVALFFKSLFYLTSELFLFIGDLFAQSPPPQQTKGEVNQNEWRIQNSHCFNFGVYLFNLTKWAQLDESQIRTWCSYEDENKEHRDRNYLAGYLKHSNLIMLVVEDEYFLSKCGSIDSQLQKRPPSWNSMTKPKKLTIQDNSSLYIVETTKIRKDYSINRYRKNPEYCHNYFPNESQIFFCKSSAPLKYPLRILLISCAFFALKLKINY